MLRSTQKSLVLLVISLAGIFGTNLGSTLVNRESANRERILEEQPIWNGFSEYDTLVLATSWQGSICSVKKCTPGLLANKNFFNIHGVWPNLSSDFRNSPFFCKPHTIKLEDLSESDKRLVNYYWISFYNDASWFLNHEWSKHGTCWIPNDKDITNTIPELKSLIKTAVQQYKKDDIAGLKSSYVRLNIILGLKYNLFKALSENGILPDNHRRIRTSDIGQAIRNAFGPSAYHLNCLYDINTGQHYINELKFSLDLNYRPNGTWKFTTECPELLVYPEYKVVV